ncbi:MAG: hypothetical protein KatS3mg115_1036 [Candidatus Poribacteria bacterium]|nr:MAG: hypothetical protein KatS3mg115_1036 [Candidatus Poribacteria bacterium]
MIVLFPPPERIRERRERRRLPFVRRAAAGEGDTTRLQQRTIWARLPMAAEEPTPEEALRALAALQRAVSPPPGEHPGGRAKSQAALGPLDRFLAAVVLSP